jgi:DNA polymerase III subunit epsilon
MMSVFWHRLRNRYHLRHLRRKDLPVAIRDYLEGFITMDLKKPVAETEFVVLDSETTGLNAKKGDRIVSISAVRLKNGRIDLSEAFHTLVNPNRDIPSETAVIHEILPRMVDGKPTIENVLPDFIRYVGSAVLVAHHAWLDMSFLNNEMNRLFGFPLQNIVVDTAILDQALVVKKTPPSMRHMIKINSHLSSLAERYHVSLEEQHSSFGDALTTAQIFQNMIKQSRQEGVATLKDFLRMAFTPPSLDLRDRGGPHA